MNYKLAEVKEFTKKCLGTRFTLKDGVFNGEEVTVVGYMDDGLGDPVVIVELPETSPDKGWGLNELDPDDHVIADVAEDVRLWYVCIENLIGC
ncbi:hypothetical protein BT681P4_00037 [Bacteroides phage BT681P4]|nr:hypothetical protein BT681P2_00013 [Bacteroides phage BT681P2]WAX09960.1 hypothetical protein BT681P4_00037 [Bacteroides phage BT681P4]